MDRPHYLSKYLFDWELFDVILGGKSALDANSFLGDLYTREKVHQFLEGYGLNQDDLVVRAELFGNFQESLQFIKRYFLKDGNESGLDLTLPPLFYKIDDVADLFLMATGNFQSTSFEQRLWAGIILKVMHTIIHIDKDLRHSYFPFIQQKIFDRFYKYIIRKDDNRLFLSNDNDQESIELKDFITKSKKSRDSIIIKLLHKPENVAEELFDRIGIRFVTLSRLDTLRVVKFLQENNIITPHNVKPSRSLNSLLDIDQFRPKYRSLIRMSIRNNLSEERFLQALNREAMSCVPNLNLNDRNTHSSLSYRSIQFTCRHLITFQNPLMREIAQIRKMAKALGDSNQDTKTKELIDKIMKLDISLISKDVRFFYPYEIQVADFENHLIQSEGEASHQEYKRSQLNAAMIRLFRPLIQFKGINVS